MFDRIIARLRAATTVTTPMPEADAQHALGALLVRVAKADGAYLFQEIEEIDHMLADLYALNAVEAAKMRAECEKLEGAMPDTNELAHILGDAVGQDQRDAFVRTLWKVADADGERHEREQQVIAITSEAFGLSPEAAAALRGPRG